MGPSQSRETVSLNIRAKVRQRDLIDRAAGQLGRSRSDFMLEAACREALERIKRMTGRKRFRRRGIVHAHLSQGGFALSSRRNLSVGGSGRWTS